jgi:hypothetical protein
VSAYVRERKKEREREREHKYQMIVSELTLLYFFAGVDFQFEVNMTIFFYFILDSENSEELIFVLKCLTISLLILTLGIAFKAFKIIH